MRDNNNLYNKALRSNIYFVFVFKIIFCSSKLVFLSVFIFIRTTPDTSASGLITIRKMISMIIMMIIIIVA